MRSQVGREVSQAGLPQPARDAHSPRLIIARWGVSLAAALTLGPLGGFGTGGVVVGVEGLRVEQAALGVGGSRMGWGQAPMCGSTAPSHRRIA
jgi:hypothetical protein